MLPKGSVPAAAACALALALPLRAEPQAPVPAAVSPSTAPHSFAESQPFSLELSRGRRDAQVRILYSLRWSGGDLGGLAPGMVRRLFSPVDTARWIGQSLRRDPVFRLYGVRIRPNDLIVEERRELEGGADGGGAPRTVVRRRLSLTPFLEDIESDLRREGFIEGMDLALPQARGLGYREKRAMAEGLLLMDRQQGLGLPARPGLEYMLDGSK